MKTLGLIPARLGSRRIKDKNLQLVNGRALVERAIICAKAAVLLDAIVVSSNDERIAPIASAHDVEFLARPDELAQDFSPMADVVKHALEHYKGFDAVCILEPPATFRRSMHVDAAISGIAQHADAIGVRTVTQLPPPPKFSHHLDARGYLVPLDPSDYFYDIGGFIRPRPIFRDNGIANVVRVSDFSMTGWLFDDKIRAIVIEDEARGLDIDWPADLALARAIAIDLDRS